jgi:hypothetical protein
VLRSPAHVGAIGWAVPSAAAAAGAGGDQSADEQRDESSDSLDRELAGPGVDLILSPKVEARFLY